MGPKASRQHQRQQQPFSSYAENYENNIRSYAKVDHQAVLVSNSIHHTAAKELQNLQKHHQLTPSPFLQIPIQQETGFSTPQINSSGRKKRRSDAHLSKQPLDIRKSRSTETLSSVVTAQQLLNDQSKRRQRNRSPSSQISTHSSQSGITEKSSSFSRANKPPVTKTKRKNIPRDLQLVLIDQKDIQVKYIHKSNLLKRKYFFLESS
jgi:hypothetical protein